MTHAWDQLTDLVDQAVTTHELSVSYRGDRRY